MGAHAGRVLKSKMASESRRAVARVTASELARPKRTLLVTGIALTAPTVTRNPRVQGRGERLRRTAGLVHALSEAYTPHHDSRGDGAGAAGER